MFLILHKPKTAFLCLLLATAMAAGCRGKTVDDYFAEGDRAFRENQIATAEQSYMAAEKKAPNDARTHVALGNLYTYEHNTDVAVGEFNEGIRLDPRNARAHLGLAKIYLDRNESGQAEEQYRAATALEPSNATAHLGLALVLRKAGKTDEAERELRTALGLDPRNAQAHYALASLLAETRGHQAEADAEYAKAAALDPKLARKGSAAAAPPSEAAPGAPAVPATSHPPKAVVEEPTARPTEAPVARASGPGPRIKPIDKKFLLTHNSAVYESPSPDSRIVGQVHRRKRVHVTGIAGDWLQIQLKSGVVGFIPTAAAE